ncbi:hypothetical protein FYJ34_05390 [Clostridiaceae bacterium 68-1-5]|uniref:Uncharacterized protein n=1 Tax=Suipraeoptans intestinalis TaxID=2606628 RepID=A0A6N7USJ7_9FIRM|nr:hypothetical protein [Suipraeoptans intestinalis]MSR93708.1 hypothetical protein [Suipraeoptans intestinalis]
MGESIREKKTWKDLKKYGTRILLGLLFTGSFLAMGTRKAMAAGNDTSDSNGSTIYVANGQESSIEGDGTQENPYQSLSYAIQRSVDGDTLKLTGDVLYRQEGTFFIDKNIVIDGQGYRLTFRGADLELKKNVRFQNMTLNMIVNGGELPRIYAAGNEVTFDEVSTTVSQLQDYLRPVLIGGSKTGNLSGNHVQISILNGDSSTRFHKIIAGGETEDVDVPVTIRIESEYARVDEGIVLGGVNGNQTTEEVTLLSNAKAVKKILAEDSIQNQVTFSASRLTGIELTGVKNLSLRDGAVVNLDRLDRIDRTVDVQEGAQLWINLKGDVRIGRITGTGEIVLSPDTSLQVGEDIRDASNIRLSGFETQFAGKTGWEYVKAEGNIHQGVSVSFLQTIGGYRIQKKNKAYVLSDAAPIQKFDKNEIQELEVTQLPQTTIYQEGQQFSSAGMILLLKDKNGVVQTVKADELQAYGIQLLPDENTPLKATDKSVIVQVKEIRKALNITVHKKETQEPEKQPEGWREDAVGKRYKTADGSYLTASWKTLDNETYYFDAKGYAVRNSWLPFGGNWYYFDGLCRMAKGWMNVGGNWYYLAENGMMMTGWIKGGTTWYYLDANGVMKTGWLNQGGSWYYLDESGAMKTGWVSLGGSWYYLAENGMMMTGWIKDGATWYYLDGSGAMKTGWLNQGGSWYYLDESGAMKTGWVSLGGSWYYLAENGTMMTGWIKSGATWYYLKANGAMAAGVSLQMEGGLYHFAGNGAWIG